MNKIFLCGILCFLLVPKAYGNPYENLYEEAVKKSLLIQRIDEESQRWRLQEEKQLKALVSYLQEHSEKDEKLKGQVREDLKADVEYFSTLSTHLNSIKVGERGTTFQLKTNKMVLGAQLALDLLESAFKSVIDGNLPQGYALDAPRVNVVGDKDHIYSSARGIALKHLLVRTALRLSQDTLSAFSKTVGLDPFHSPFIHYTPLPSDFQYDGLKDFPYYKEDHQGQFIAILHNGYTFGGHRREKKQPFSPEDCSSFVAKYIGIPPVSTLTLAAFYQCKEGFQFTTSPFKPIVQEWENLQEGYRKDSEILALDKVLKPLKIESAQVRAGLVHGERRYTGVDKDPKVALYGNGGHVGFTLGTLGQGPDTKTVTIGTNRDLEGTNRDFIFGLESRPYLLNSLKDQTMVMYFDINHKGFNF